MMKSGKPLILIRKMIFLNNLLIMENFNSIMVDFNVFVLISWNFQFLFSKEKKKKNLCLSSKLSSTSPSTKTYLPILRTFGSSKKYN